MQRQLDKSIESGLLGSALWNNKLKDDCRNGEVFMAIRKNIVDFYHKGGRLFSFDGKDYTTHLKYAATIIGKDKDYLTENELQNYKLPSNFQTNYRRIKENCFNFSGIEAIGVSEIYHKHSYLSNENVVVLDIEVSFKALDPNRTQDRIDILLFNTQKKTLQFVEAKHYSNKELWSTTTPKIISQIRRYEQQISKSGENIISAYSDYIEAVNRIFSLHFPLPVKIDPKVSLLIFGFDDDQKNGRLRKLITGNRVFCGVKTYCKGDIKSIVPENLWNAKVL
ncbi:MAG: hypothetical protein GX639_04455 [Fibrobacter sp.]|nr:hypothetical protein [Fibrobacter sp.]